MNDTFKCPFPDCKRAYVSSTILRRHTLAFHSQQNKFQCKVCNKSLASRQNLNEHYFIHSGEKPYFCKVPGCGASFRQGTHMSAHKKFHQKSSSAISLEGLTKELTKLRDSLENSCKGESIVLPEFVKEKNFCSLPNLFEQ